MKKSFLFIFTICSINLALAQDSTELISKINKIDQKTDRIEDFIKKIEANDQKIKSLEQRNESLINESASHLAQKKELIDRINTLKTENSSLQIQVDNIVKYKMRFEKIINSLLKEHANFNQEIISILEDANLMANFSNASVLDNFKKFKSTIDGVKKYIETQPYDEIENNNHLKSLAELKTETAKLKFSNLEADVDYYTNLLGVYCLATKIVGTKIEETAGNASVRNAKLVDLKKNYKNYVFLISELDKALGNVNYKFIFKASCTD